MVVVQTAAQVQPPLKRLMLSTAGAVVLVQIMEPFLLKAEGPYLAGAVGAVV